MEAFYVSGWEHVCLTLEGSDPGFIYGTRQPASLVPLLSWDRLCLYADFFPVNPQTHVGDQPYTQPHSCWRTGLGG